jgi:imidazolonepropionase-like amidohydrolase
LVDSHTHLSIVPALGNQGAQHIRQPGVKIMASFPNIRKQMESGVTALRVMGEEHFIDVDFKNAINSGLIKGPRLFISGVQLTATNGHLSMGTTSDMEFEIRKTLRKNFSKGADFGKLFLTGGMSSTYPTVDACTYTREEVAAAVEECARMKTYIAAHAHGGPGIDFCIDEGVKTIEHGALLTENQVERMIEKGMSVVGTFSILFHPTGIEQTDFSDPVIREKCIAGRKIESATWNMIINSGVHFAIGTDALHGLMAYEMECLVNFGATNMQAIMAATKNGAEILLMDKLIGTLEEGKLADFIAVSGNPLEDIKNMSNVDLVFKDGELLVDKRQTLSELY